MLTTILDEAVNGWIVTIFRDGKKEQFIYETLHEAQSHLGGEEAKYEYNKQAEVKRHASTL